MILIIGGSHQGRLDYARSRFGLVEADIFVCTEATEAPDLSKRCVAQLDRFALNRVRAGADPVDFFAARRDALGDRVLIATDIACGVVPVDPVMRAWREANGRLNHWLAGQADEVWRLFCGLPQRLK